MGAKRGENNSNKRTIKSRVSWHDNFSNKNIFVIPKEYKNVWLNFVSLFLCISTSERMVENDEKTLKNHESFFFMSLTHDGKGTFSWFSNVFHHLQPCKRMLKPAFAGQNTQQPIVWPRKLPAFADDNQIIRSNMNLALAKQSMKASLNIIVKWLANSGLKTRKLTAKVWGSKWIIFVFEIFHLSLNFFWDFLRFLEKISLRFV